MGLLQLGIVVMIVKIVTKTFTRLGATLLLLAAFMAFVRLLSGFSLTTYPAWFHWMFMGLFGYATFCYTVYIKDVHMRGKLAAYVTTLVLLMIGFGFHGMNALHANLPVPRAAMVILVPLYLFLAVQNWRFEVDDKKMSKWDLLE